MKFCGAVVKPHRAYLSNRTIGRLQEALRNLARTKGVGFKELERRVSTVNSYLGMARHYNGFRLLSRLVAPYRRAIEKVCVIDLNLHRVVLKREIKNEYFKQLKSEIYGNDN